MSAAVELKMIALIWPVSCLFSNTANKHKPWLEPTYHGIVTENDDAVLLDPPLIALDKDAPLRFAGTGRPAPAPGAWALRGACSPVPGCSSLPLRARLGAEPSVCASHAPRFLFSF